MNTASMKSGPRMIRPLVHALALLLVAVGGLLTAASPASAETARTISGTITCANGNLSYGSRVVGVWVHSSAGDSRWAKSTRNSTYQNITTFSAKITTKASSTKIRLDIGCGGTSKKWASNNSTPEITVKGSKTGLRIKCSEASGNRATRCSYISTKTCAKAYGVSYPMKIVTRKIPFKNIPMFTMHNDTSRDQTMSVKRAVSGSVSVSVNGSTSAEIGAVGAKASMNLGFEVGVSYSVSTEVTATISVPPKTYGNAQYASIGVRSTWSKKKMNASCSKSSTISSGVYDLPRRREGWIVTFSKN